MNELLAYVIMSDRLMVAYVQFVITSIELTEVLSQELKCLCTNSTTVLLEESIPKTVDDSLLHFYCIRNK